MTRKDNTMASDQSRFVNEAEGIEIVYHNCLKGAPVDMMKGEVCLRCNATAGEDAPILDVGTAATAEQAVRESRAFIVEPRANGDFNVQRPMSAFEENNRKVIPEAYRTLETLPDDRTAADILSEGAATYRERNAVYGSSYQRMGPLLIALFEDDAVPPCETAEDANRLNLIINCASKLQRYAHNFHNGGHKDSAHDLMVYAAMLEEMTNG